MSPLTEDMEFLRIQHTHRRVAGFSRGKCRACREAWPCRVVKVVNALHVMLERDEVTNPYLRLVEDS